jgi:PBP1b-binding outer membrane lipoprotein LpoB
MKKIITIVTLALTIQSCVPLAIMVAADHVSKAKTASAEKLQRSMDLKTYAQYRVDMERLNFDREKVGLKTHAIMTQEEWIGSQTAGRPAIAPVIEEVKK